jgi:amino acid adenylation domain-containing protein/thioester reductase-like protein
MFETADRVGDLCSVFRLEGEIDVPRLRRAIRQVIDACPPFAYKFMRLGDSLQIVVSPDPDDALSVVDASSGDESVAYGLIRSLTSRRFRLDGGPPYLFCLIQGPDVSYLVFASHPILIDRFSLKPLFLAISRAYAGEAPSRDLSLSQDDLLAAEQRLLTAPSYPESIRFWLHMVRDTAFEWHPPRLESDLTDSSFCLSLDETTTSALKALAQRLEIGTDELMLFSFHLFMSRLIRNDAVLTSYCHRIRTSPLERIGFSENKRAFKSIADPEQTIGGFLRQASRLFAQTRFHSDIPARDISREMRRLEPKYTRSTNLLFSDDYLPYGELSLAGVRATLLPAFSHRLDIEDISIYFDVRERIDFHATLRSPQETSGLYKVLQHYTAMLERLSDELAKPLREVTLFNEPLRRQVLALSDGGELRTSPVDVMIEFAGLAERLPQAPAVRFGDRQLSYGDLYRSALAIAGRLAPALQAEREPLVGICLPRGEGMIQAIFGVLAAGAGYVPLDPQMPADRLSFILQDASPLAVIVDSSTRSAIEAVGGKNIFSLEDLLAGGEATALERPVAVPPEHPVYVIYTSGTTGKPKGVVLERRNLAHYLASLSGLWDRGPGVRWLQFAAFTFDASVLDIFNSLIHGAELVITPSESRTNPEAVFRLLEEARITHADLPPALLPLLPRRPLPSLRVIISGGEAIDEETSRFWSKTAALANCYGPTEASVMATVNTMGGYKAATHLGRPLRGYQTYLLDDNGQLAPQGAVGEICIGGGGVARGYRGRPELTAQKFIANPFGEGRLYRTGDLARFLPNGDLEFLGRSDFQVKIRGFRIELGDIEGAITDQPEVHGAHVGVIDRDGSKSLVAWYIGRGLSTDTLRQRLSLRLPHYMVPAFLVSVESFPLTLNGKIDRARLPSPFSAGDEAPSETLDALQTKVRDVWASVLKAAPETISLKSHFFHLGGHSLLVALACNRLSAALGGVVRPKALFESPVFADFCEHLRAIPAETTPRAPLVATEAKAAPVESRLIGLIYSRAINSPQDNSYNIVARIEYSSEVHPVMLRQALRQLIEENPIFGSAFGEREGRIWIEQVATGTPLIPITDGTRAMAEARGEAMRRETLGVKQAPLWRAEIFCQEDGVTTLLFSIHHALFDGWSLNLFNEELAARYEALVQKKPYCRRRLTWFDHCLWAQGLSDTQPFKDSVAYWRKKLAGANARVELPVGATQAKPNSNEAISVRLDPRTVSRLKAFADGQGITLPPLLFSLYLVWLWRLSGQDELVCGYPYAGRDVPGTEEIYGTFVAMGFLRQAIRSDQAFGELARAVHRQMIDDKEHLVAAPYDAEIANMDSLNVIFSLQSGISLEGTVGDATFRAHELPSMTSKGDIAGVFYQTRDGGIEGRLEYDSSLLRPEAMERFVSVFQTLVSSVAADPQARVGDIAYLSAADSGRLMEMACGPRMQSVDRSIPARFAEIVAKHGADTALIFGERQLSFRELDLWSDAIASAFRASIRPGELVGLSLEKSDAAVAAILAVLKCGSAYVPLDPGYPPERLRYFAENSRLRTVVADDSSRASLASAGLASLRYLTVPEIEPSHYLGVPKGEPAASALEPVSPDALAYIIHTSGSTGTPKGVMIEHRTVVRMIEASQAPMRYGPGCRSGLIASLSFDTSVIEMFLPLLSGATLYVVPEGVRKNPAELHRVLSGSGVTHVILSPVVLQNMPHQMIPGLRFLGFGGDAIDEATADWWCRQTSLFSLYGPTETTVQASVGEILPGGNSRIIGKPLPGYRLYLLDRQRQPVPFGAVGEICIGGGAARGYLNRDDLTHERFVIDPFDSSPYALMYLSGDLGRYLDDGTIEFLGRNDSQVKIRGYRIELGEIENRLSLNPEIRHVACAVRGQGEARALAAYYVADREIPAEELRGYLSGFLPEFMIPSFYLRMPQLPASPNGKIDRKALPDISARTCENPPRPGLESDIAHVWEEVLRYRGVGRDENFFHIGGNSLLAVRMQAELRRRLGIHFSIAEFYGAPTIEALASGGTGNSIPAAVRDAQAPIELAAPAPAAATLHTPPRSVLLTGAGGFLGIFLLAELCRKVDHVYAMVRGADGIARLEQAPREAGVSIDPERITVVSGDLAAPGLGLDTGMRERLATEVDAILHCGAYVHHLHGYAEMKAANVGGTRELLELALEKRLKRFCFVSTLTVGMALEGVDTVREAVLPNRPIADNGYILSKWVGEQLVAQCARRYGLPAVIARPGNITGSSTDGFSNYATNHFWLFNKGCLQLGMYPDIGARVEMMPVDTLARAITALTLGAHVQLLVANLSNPVTIDQADLFAKARVFGRSAQPVAADVWQRSLSTISEDNGLATIKDLYAGDLSGTMPPIEQTGTLAALAEGGVSLRADYDKLVPLYLEYLSARGFFSPA